MFGTSAVSSRRSRLLVTVATIGVFYLFGNQSAHAQGALQDTRIVVRESCPITDKQKILAQRHAFPLLAILGTSLLNIFVPKIVDAGISYAAREAKAAGAADNGTLQKQGVTTIESFYKFRKKAEDESLTFGPTLAEACLVVVQGAFGAKLGAVTGKWAKPEPKKFLAENGFSRSPDIYLEARVRISPDRSHFRIEPLYLDVAKSLHANASQTVDLKFDFKFEKGGAAETGTSFAMGSLVFVNMTKEELEDVGLDTKSTGWMPVLAMEAPIQEILKRVSGLYAERLNLTKNIAKLRSEVQQIDTLLQGRSQDSDPKKQKERFEDKRREALLTLKGDKFNDALYAAILDNDKCTTSVPNLPDSVGLEDCPFAPPAAALPAAPPAAAGKAAAGAAGKTPWTNEVGLRTVARLKALDERDRAKAELQGKVALAERGLSKLAEIELSTETLTEKANEIVALEKSPPEVAPVNVVVTISETNHKPENKFLLTIGELLENSKTDLVNLAKTNLTPEGLEAQKQAELTKRVAQGELESDARTKRTALLKYEIALRDLPASASESERLDAKLAVMNAKEQANAAYAKAGWGEPF